MIVRLPAPKRWAFTLVEVLIVTLILGIFLSVAYTLFFGGNRIAGKASWLQSTTTDLRKAELVITKAIQTTSYPSTLLPGKLVDAGGTTAAPGPNSPIFYVHIPGGVGKKTATTLLGNRNGIVMYLARCSPEKQGFGAPEDRAGQITWMVIKIEPSPEKAGQGNLFYEERPASFNTVGPDYASLFGSDVNAVATRLRMQLVRNVEWIEIDTVPGHSPSKITITISASYPREPAVVRSGVSAAVPNVGIAVP